MNVEKIVVDRAKARDLYRKYKAHQHYSEPIDQEIQRAYQLMAQGRMVIKALASIVAAGLGEMGMPKLAIANATHKLVEFRLEPNGSGYFSDGAWRTRSKRNVFRFPAGSFRRMTAIDRFGEKAEAIVPLVPIHLRPKRGLQNYHILFEAEWRKVPPRDPMLLRRLGGDLWVVVAAWDLTEVERAAMATRVSA